MKKKIIILICSLAASLGICSCSSSNEKEPATDFYSDSEYHWAYDEDGNEVKKEKHTFNENHKCTDCEYEDSVLVVDQDGTLLGLTEHGKTLSNITLTDEVFFISNGAFDDSSIKKIYIPDSVLGIEEEAYNFISNLEIEKESSIGYEKYDTVYYQTGYYDNEYACRIKSQKYKTLDDALEAVEEDNTRIYLLSDEHTLTKTHELSLNVRIVRQPLSLHVLSASIEGDLTVLVSSILEFGTKITYEGNINLKIRTIDAKCNSGSVAFQGLDEAPGDVTVRYIGEHITTNDKIVRGGIQTCRKLIIFNIDYYAYGVTEFNKDFNTITGLSNFAKICSSLTLTAPIEGIKAAIANQAFSHLSKLKIKFIKTFVEVDVYLVDGIFNHLTLGDGITKTGSQTFKSRTDSKISSGLDLIIQKITCHLSSLTLGKDLETVEYESFGWEYKLVTINGGEGLTHIHKDAFTTCRNLKSVNLINATNLIEIYYSFPGCNILTRFVLPKSNGWQFKYNDNDIHTYLYEDLSPEFVAEMILLNDRKVTKVSDSDTKEYAVYNPTRCDQNNVPCFVNYYSSLQEALNNTNFEVNTIRLLNTNVSLADKTFNVNENITIDGTKLASEKVTLNCIFKVKSGCKITFTDRVNFIGTII